MYALYKDPQGKKVFDKSRPSDRPSERPPTSPGNGNGTYDLSGRRGTLEKVRIIYMPTNMYFIYMCV